MKTLFHSKQLQLHLLKVLIKVLQDHKIPFVLKILSKVYFFGAFCFAEDVSSKESKCLPVIKALLADHKGFTED